MKLRYFAWVRERIGRSEEEVEPPAAVTTAGELVLWLKSRDERSDYAFERPEVVRIAIDQLHVKPDARIAGAREIAFFPPMTGG
ncbi:MAG: molybdopterin converting factor subunit 1 [Ancalomicrobiaceae bacterium]|nr:molybdopterin converting factor subunit 1 [Ancalomicrobiaceae bacterium]